MVPTLLQFVTNFLYAIFVGLIIWFGNFYQQRLSLMAGMMELDPRVRLLYISFFPIAIGIFIALPQFISTIRRKSDIRFNWIKFVSIGLPTLYVSMLPLIYYSIGKPLPFATLLLQYSMLHTLSGVVFGYLLLTSFEKLRGHLT